MFLFHFILQTITTVISYCMMYPYYVTILFECIHLAFMYFIYLMDSEIKCVNQSINQSFSGVTNLKSRFDEFVYKHAYNPRALNMEIVTIGSIMPKPHPWSTEIKATEILVVSMQLLMAYR